MCFFSHIARRSSPCHTCRIAETTVILEVTARISLASRPGFVWLLTTSNRHISEFALLGAQLGGRQRIVKGGVASSLKRAGASVKDLVYYYQPVIRPVLEYACPAWHSGLTKEQTKTIEDVQRRVCRVILGNVSYDEACRTLNVSMLSDRRDEQCKTLFKQITNQPHIGCCQQSVTLSSSAVCDLLNCIQLVMHTQLVFLNLLYHIHWLIFSDSILFVINMYHRCILCMCICVVIIQLFRLPYVNKHIVSYRNVTSCNDFEHFHASCSDLSVL